MNPEVYYEANTFAFCLLKYVLAVVEIVEDEILKLVI